MSRQTETGYRVERLFEDRLIALGYAPILWPRQDQGADCVVWTEHGWQGIQIKSLAHRPPRPQKSQFKPEITLHLIALNSTARHKSWARKTGKAYYISRGVTIIAGFVNGGFYLLPIHTCNDLRTHIGPGFDTYWEAWGKVLGMPVAKAVAPVPTPTAFSLDSQPLEVVDTFHL